MSVRIQSHVIDCCPSHGSTHSRFTTILRLAWPLGSSNKNIGFNQDILRRLVAVKVIWGREGISEQWEGLLLKPDPPL